MADRTRTPSGDRRFGGGAPTSADPVDRAAVRRFEESEDSIPVFKDGVIIGDGSGSPGGLSSTVTIAPPLTASGLTLTTGANESRVYIDASWTASASTDVVEYEVEVTRTGAGTVRIVRTAGSSVRVEPVEPNVSYDVRVRSVNRLGVLSAYTGTQTITSATDSTVPAQVTGLSVAAAYKTLTATWTENTEVDVKNGNGAYEVQLATNSGFTTGLRTVRTSGTVTTFGDLAGATTYYVRVRAVDSSGNAGTYSTTASTTTAAIATADVHDGSAPASSPTATVTGGPTFLAVKWTAVSNADPVTYEVHVSATNGFTPSSATKYAETAATSIIIKALADGSAFAYGTTYYVKLIAKDADGSAAAGTQGSASMVQIVTADITSSAVTASKLSVTMGGGNLITNSTLLNGLTGFSGFSGTGTDTNLPIKSFTTTYATKVTNGAQQVIDLTGRVTAAIASKPFSLSLYAMNPNFGNGDQIQLWIEWYDSGGVFISRSVTANLILASTWTRHSLTATAPSNAAQYNAYLDIVGVSSGNTLRFAGFQLEYGDVPTAYAPKVDEIAPNAVGTTQVADNAITSAKIIAGAIVAGKIAAGVVTATEIAASTITGAKIAANTITAANIAADTITANEIAASAITASELAANAVTASKILAGSVSTEHLTVGGVSENAVYNPSFEDATVADATRAASWTYDYIKAGTPTYDIPSAGAYSGAKGLSIVSATSADSGSVASRSIPVVAGENWYVGTYAKASSAASSGFFLRAHFGTSDQFSPGYKAVVTAFKPTSYWRLGESSGTTAADVMGVNAGTYVGSPTLGVTANVPDDTAVTFNGSTQRVTLGSTAIPKTIVAWIKTTTAAQRPIWSNRPSAAPNSGVYFGIQANGKLFAYANTSLPDGGAVVNDGNWHCVAWTNSGTAGALYVDGVQRVAPTNQIPTAVTSTAWIGWDQGNNEWFNGTIDDVATYNRVLSAAEITALYNAGPRAATYTDIATDAALTTSFALKEAQVVVPASKTFMRVEVVNSLSALTFYADEVVARKVTGTAQILDAAITNAKIGSLAVDTAKIADLAVSTAKIAALAVTSAKINDVTADKITAGNITATLSVTTGMLRTDVDGGGVNNHRYIILDGNGLRFYTGGSAAYTGGTLTAELNTSTGSASFSGTVTSSTITGGTIRTAASGKRVELSGSSADDRVQYFSGLSTEVQAGYVGVTTTGSGSTGYSLLQISPPALGTAAFASLSLRSTSSDGTSTKEQFFASSDDFQFLDQAAGSGTTSKFKIGTARVIPPHYFVRAHGSTATTLAAGAFTTITLNVEDADFGGHFASNTFTAPVTGYYLFSWALESNVQNNPQDYTSAIFVNGTERARGSGQEIRGGSNGDPWRTAGSSMELLTAGDTVVLKGYQGGGANTTATAVNAISSPFLAIAYLGSDS